VQSLFEVSYGDEFLSAARAMNEVTLEAVEGLTYRPEFISPNEELELLDELDRVDWSTEMQRRVYSFGSEYGAEGQRVGSKPLPEWAQRMAVRLHEQGLFDPLPDRALANEYLPGQGISPHVDYVSDFGDTVASLSLGSDVVMDFSRGTQRHQAWLARRSVVVMKGTARYEWTHGIARRKTDKVDSFTVPRGRRVSLTFRASILR
jgi:alkylated DNA repair dioxygenase AlkB